jgi:uncharacterized Zn-binding protein involved in type VI secretion
MPAAQRVGDADSAGGVVTGGVSSVRVNNRPIAVRGNPVTPHPCCGRRRCGAHCSARVSVASPNVRAGNIPVTRTGDSDSCGHARSGGSPNVRVN